MAEPCAYRVAGAGEEYDFATGVRTPVAVCTWPSSVIIAPPWFAQRVGHFPPVEPEIDCVGCPVRCEKSDG